MPSLKYDTEVDLSNPNSSHTLIVELVGANKTVLDVGCATGYLARALVERGCTVSGFERDPEAAAVASGFLDKLVVGDLETVDLGEAFGGGSYDAIVFGDVLEHLRDPLPVLRQAKTLLAPGGSVVASIPNVAHGSVRLALLQGRFDYRPLGLLDETHLRFFTRASIERLLRLAGLAPVDVRRTTTGIFETHVKVDPAEVPPEVVERVMSDPEALTYQFVVRAVVDDADASVAALHARFEAQAERLVQLHAELAASEAARTEAAVRAEQHQARVVELEGRVDALAADLEWARAELARVLDTRTMRLTSPLRATYGRVRGLLGL
jgi:2-polyprenyl-3-methyl-5-hydroxy-6-metoxy-1,4-benzoquinol methylase